MNGVRKKGSKELREKEREGRREGCREGAKNNKMKRRKNWKLKFQINQWYGMVERQKEHSHISHTTPQTFIYHFTHIALLVNSLFCSLKYPKEVPPNLCGWIPPDTHNPVDTIIGGY